MEPSDCTYARLEREIGDSSELIERYEANSSMRAWYRAVFDIRYGSFTLDDYARAVSFGRDLERLVPLAVTALAGYCAEDGEAVADLLAAFSGLPDDWWDAHRAQLAALTPLADRIVASASRFDPGQQARIELAREKLCARANGMSAH